ncbi:hypothetical protein GCM10010294_65990 [Streptomyces griseoloalbus]|nr:hypothetical protein GCM10010294_65990 [Streptomyces griseoloalbus]
MGGARPQQGFGGVGGPGPGCVSGGAASGEAGDAAGDGVARPGFPALSRAYGGAGAHAASPAELRDAVGKALTTPGPTVIEVPEPPG